MSDEVVQRGEIRIAGAVVHDGTGGPPERRDVRIVDGRIAEVSRDLGRSEGHVIDADGLVLAPGFIDMHSHSDFTLPAYPDAFNGISQGVTSEVTGNCGSSPAPLAEDPRFAAQWRARAGIAGERLDWEWRDFASYLERLDAAQPAVNVIPLVGHGALRAAVMGMRTDPATSAEIVGMRELLGDALAAGAWGMSSGLGFVPGSSATPDELADLAADVARANGIYATHLRDEGDGLMAALDEALAIGASSGARVQISHLKVAGRRNHGTIGQALSRIDDARRHGVNAQCDVYPYLAGSTYLRDLLPAWVLDEGPPVAVTRLADPELRARVRAEVELGNEFVDAESWDNVVIDAVASPDLAYATGQRVTDLAAQAGTTPADVVLDLLVADRAATTMLVFFLSQADNDEVLRSPIAAIGSDQYGVVGPSAQVHPRSYGAHTRVLGWGVRDHGLMSLAEAIRKMTGLPATIMGITDRGFVRPGLIADLVLFDPARVEDVAGYGHPTERARGIEYVFVRGRTAVDRGELADLRAGAVIRRPSASSHGGST